MLAMKGPDQLLESRPRERPGAELTRQLEALMLVAKVGEPACVERPRAAKGHQRERARIMTASDRHRANRARHVVVHDLDDARRRFFDAELERTSDLRFDRSARRFDVERQFAAEER